LGWRLGEVGGSIGVRVLTFDLLYAECLNTAGEVYTEISDPVQHRLIRAIVDELPLTHYAPLTDRPGFLQLVQEMIAELKAGRIWPEAFERAVKDLGSEPRLVELSEIYTVYQEKLQARRWADRAGMGWLALEVLQERAPNLGSDWPLLIVDGFDNLTPVQLELLHTLSNRVGETVITLTGVVNAGRESTVAFRRFDETRKQLENRFGISAVPLPRQHAHSNSSLRHLEANIFQDISSLVANDGCVRLIEAPDRDGEVRAALRWIKKALVETDARPDEIALLARSPSAYRDLITQAAAEYGIPIRMAEGLPLRGNPAIAALLDLLRLVLPGSTEESELSLPRRPLIEAWRSPYFDWSALPQEGGQEPIGITSGDADRLDTVARWGRVISGRQQWWEALNDLANRSSPEPTEDEERGLPGKIPIGSAARDLRDKFERFVQRITPPAGKQSYRSFVSWLEALIGPDPDLSLTSEEMTALQIIAQVRAVAGERVERDVAALREFKEVLRGLVWAEEALNTAAVDYTRFIDELVGVVEASRYHLPLQPGQDGCLVTDIARARGIPFRMVTVLGLSEGEFPTTLAEDPLLRDSDRKRLHDESDLPLELSTESAEAELFYAAITRPREKLLLTRPRLADNGAPWQASPYWEELQRLIAVEPTSLTSESVPTPEQAASWPELMESLASHPDFTDVQNWVQSERPHRQIALDRASQLFQLRRAGRSFGAAQDLPFDAAGKMPYDGDLRDLDCFSDYFGPHYIWSASRLESYRSCPFSFFIGSVLKLEPRQEPAEGLDARQLGNIYHKLFERLYEYVQGSDPTDLEQLLFALEQAAQEILAQAPKREGFRETAWWKQTREEIVENVRRSLEALAELSGHFRPLKHEAAFGLHGHPELVVVRDDDDSFLLRGLIDRVDRSPDGQVRVIDYKTAGPSPFSRKAVIEGKKLQLPLYALAARDALGLGEPAEGFYWHIRHAEPSGFRLGDFPEALQVAVDKAWEAIDNARGGNFVPQPPSDGCPSYCPAVTFCWHYRSGFRG
jgi:ATP-dependent helicase/DNAse subunit B